MIQVGTSLGILSSITGGCVLSDIRKTVLASTVYTRIFPGFTDPNNRNFIKFCYIPFNVKSVVSLPPVYILGFPLSVPPDNISLGPFPWSHPPESYLYGSGCRPSGNLRSLATQRTALGSRGNFDGVPFSTAAIDISMRRSRPSCPDKKPSGRFMSERH